jgi:hypothetical protein
LEDSARVDSGRVPFVEQVSVLQVQFRQIVTYSLQEFYNFQQNDSLKLLLTFFLGRSILWHMPQRKRNEWRASRKLGMDSIYSPWSYKWPSATFSQLIALVRLAAEAMSLQAGLPFSEIDFYLNMVDHENDDIIIFSA